MGANAEVQRRRNRAEGGHRPRLRTVPPVASPQAARLTNPPSCTSCLVHHLRREIGALAPSRGLAPRARRASARMSGMGVELLEVRDFLAQHPPFDMLPPAALDQVPLQCTLRYARRGTVVLDVGDRGAGLYVVRSGAVDVVDEAGGLVERVGTGGAFGMGSLLERRGTRYRCTATEDTLLLVLPPKLFEALAREH